MQMRRWLALGVLALLAACGSNGTDPGSDGSTGAGPTGTGGTGTGGSGGGTGGGGHGGSTGGTAGGTTGGSAGGLIGPGGAAGTGGGPGVGGASGTGGTTGGSGGSAGGGKGGSAGSTGGATTGGTGGSAGKGGSSAQATACSSDADCASNDKTKICDLTTDKCVGCLPTDDKCPSGQYCSTVTKLCAPGCKKEGDCAGTQHCDVNSNSCKDCLKDTDCADGSVCGGGTCHAGCSATKACPNGTETCCGTTCEDLTSDLNNCGACGTPCKPLPHGTPVCAGSACGLGACEAGFADCNGDASDGCEVDTMANGACVCNPGVDTMDCYDGPMGTEGVGLCQGGKRVCAPSGLGYLPGCNGQVLPAKEQCGNVDHDCNGMAGDVPDVDGDGWTACNGDCCEDTTQCGTPNLVNPGAYDVPGDAVDDDCSGTAATTAQDCSPPATFANVTPSEMAQAMELCNTTTDNPPLPQKTWGVISAQFLLADGSALNAASTGDITNNQAAILAKYGVNGPRKNSSFAGMSSGRMRDEGGPNYTNPNPGSSFSSTTSPPPAYLAAHMGNLPASAGCSGNCPAGTGANDSVLLRLRIRVPTNAKSFSYDLRFFSSEYKTYQCTAFNDFYLALLTTGAAGIPADHNISFDSKNNPISVNNGFFDVCTAKGCNVCPSGTGDLSGTGMEVGNTGGATKWLTTTAPVVPGEVMTLDLMIFDVTDSILDSLTLLDNFQWSATPSSGPTTVPAM